MNEKRVGQAAEATRIPLRFQTSPLLRILLVEDDTGIRQLSTKMLLSSGYHVDAVEDGAVAWDTLQESSYDLLLTDNRMPKVTGVELLKKLHGARMILPVILATGTLPEAEFASNPSIQPAAVLLKPYTSAALLRTVQKVLREAEVPPFTTQMLMDLDSKDSTTSPAGGLADARPTNPPCRILAVEDDRDVRSLHADVLADPGYNVDIVKAGAVAWARLPPPNESSQQLRP